MADAKISELSNLTGANLATTDEFVVNDGGATTVAITAAEVLNFINTGLLFTINTVTVTDATYAPTATFEVLNLNHASTPIAITYAAEIPVGSVVVIFATDNGASSHTVTLAGSQTWDGTNNIATFNAAEDFIVIVALSATRVLILVNNSVTLST